MLEGIPDSLSVHDIHQWLNNGWFWINDPDTGDLVPALWCFVDEDDGTMLCSKAWREGDMIKRADVRVQPENVYIYWPRCGALNVQEEKCAVFLERHQTRQYRRTYNRNSLELSVPRQWEAMRTRGTGLATLDPMSESIVLAAFSPEYPCYEEARDRLEEGWFSVALNPYVIIVGSPTDHYVYFGNDLVGRVVSGQLSPIGKNRQHLRRLLKYFNEEVTLCLSETSVGRIDSPTARVGSA